MADLVILPGIECIILMLICLYLLWGYAERKRTSIFVYLLTLVGWFLSFQLVVFIPLDIFIVRNMESNQSADSDVDQEPKMHAWWAFTYWIGNALSFFIIPLVQGYVLAGEFQKIERVQRAILLNVPIFLIYFLGFLILLLMIFFLDKSILKYPGVIAIGVAMALAAGLWLLVLFMGYGLVKIPV